MTIDDMAKDIAQLIIAEKFELAKEEWKRFTTGMITTDIMRLRQRIEVIEGRLLAGFEEVKNSDTGDL